MYELRFVLRDQACDIPRQLPLTILLTSNYQFATVKYRCPAGPSINSIVCGYRSTTPSLTQKLEWSGIKQA